LGPDNDGAGSGLDADLLDGRQASDFALWPRFRATGTVLQQRRLDHLPGTSKGSVHTIGQHRPRERRITVT
jgi:hypothetical protein